MITLDPEQVIAARNGDRAALDALVRAVERPVFNIAIRMLAQRADAENATQEILIKIVTHFGSLREVEAAGAWALRVACRHLVSERKRGAIEALRLTFRGYAADLEDGLAPLSDAGLSDAEAAVALEEVKIGCTLAMLLCLTRDLRIAYILGEIFELTDAEAAGILETKTAAYRQRLRRARATVTEFTRRSCGLVSTAAACRCDRRVAPALRLGRIARGSADLASAGLQRRSGDAVRGLIGRIERARTAAALMRSNPDFDTQVGRLVAGLLDAGKIEV